MNYKKIISLSAGTALLASMVLITPALAASEQGRMMGILKNDTNRVPGMMKPSVSGIVTAINGNTITISGHMGFGTTTTSSAITYTINATNAVVKKNNATSTVSAIVVGDRISIQGTITGTNVVATAIFDGAMMGRSGERGEWKNDDKTKMSSSTPILGNGQPVIAGTVSTISGSVLTVTTTSGVTYTVDATNAKFLKGQNSITLSGIVVGDRIIAQGTINGNSVIASTVIDQVAPVNEEHDINKSPAPRGFFGSIGQFFSHLFGF